MARKIEKKPERGFWLPATVFVAVTLAAMVWIGGETDVPDGVSEQADPPTVEVQALIPKGKIAAASWRGTATDEADVEEDVEPAEDAGTSVFDEMDEFRNRERKAKAAENLEKTVENLHGLAVYVAPANKK